MISNYKDKFKAMSKRELIKILTISHTLAEKYEVESIGGTHNKKHIGADGFAPNGDHIEIKTQTWIGAKQLFGRGGYNHMSINLADSKCANNEKIIFVGYDPLSGDVYYRFSVLFEDLKENYIRMAIKSKGSRGEFFFANYKNAPSFKVLHIAKKKILKANEHKFTPGFFTSLFELKRRTKCIK